MTGFLPGVLRIRKSLQGFQSGVLWCLPSVTPGLLTQGPSWEAHCSWSHQTTAQGGAQGGLDHPLEVRAQAPSPALQALALGMFLYRCGQAFHISSMGSTSQRAAERFKWDKLHQSLSTVSGLSAQVTEALVTWREMWKVRHTLSMRLALPLPSVSVTCIHKTI